MSGLIEDCFKYYNTRNLYSVLGIESDSDESQVKKGYRRVSLKVHPDRVEPEQQQEATLKFQILGKVYSILSDKEKRAVYDETGEVVGDDEFNDEQKNRDWNKYWRQLFSVVTVDDIVNYERNYKESDEELADLKEAYLKYEGDMDKIMQCVLCANVIDDEPRLTEILNNLIKSQEIPDFPKFSKETTKKKERRKRKAEKEAKELKKELGDDSAATGNNSLTSLIKQRQKSRESEMNDFFSHLEQKYANQKPTKNKSKKSKK
ncbi:dnaJ homolog subfamily C member 9-like [Tubulanus polymorphus]|uniref:dnaJ homolog subfamily C member 9-like n=1 Tax=Tubulanus polymorphus TaxID=672921 RepID=UPI003DA47202